MFLVNSRSTHLLKKQLLNKSAFKKSKPSSIPRPSAFFGNLTRTPVFKISGCCYYQTCISREKQTGQTNAEDGNARENGNSESEPEIVSKLKKELEHTNKVLEETTNALQETKDKLLRSYSERENIIRIAKRDVESAKDFGIRSFVLKLFDVIDTLDICLKNLPAAGDVQQKNPDLYSAITGIEATKKQFLKVMESYSVYQLETKVGHKFDPNLHNAVFEMQPTDASQEPQSIGVIIKGGWMREKTLLRPTHVGVIMKKFERVQEKS